jgi:hypothetical protein
MDTTSNVQPKPTPQPPPNIDPNYPGYPIPAVTVTYYIERPEKKGFWGFVFFIDGYSDGSESLARKVSWDRVLGFVDISFLQDIMEAFWHIRGSRRKIKPSNEEMAGKGAKYASQQTPDSKMNPNNTTNADGEEIDDQGKPTNRIIDTLPGEIKSLNRILKTFTITREDSIIYQVVNSPGDTITRKWEKKKNGH